MRVLAVEKFCRQCIAALTSLLSLQLLCMLPTALVAGQQPEEIEAITEKVWKQGFHGFRLIAEGAGLKFNDTKQWLESNEDDRALVVIGDLKDLPLNLHQIQREGIPILIVSENQDIQSLSRFGVRIIHSPVRIRNSRDRYRWEDCPQLYPGRYRRSSRHQLFENVESLVTNRPGYFVANSSDVQRLLFLPMMSTDPFPRTLVATFDAGPRQGRLAMVADTTMFTNQMLLIEDNAVFAENLFQWISENDRSELLMLVDGRVQRSVDPSAIQILPPAPTREEVLNALKNLPPEAMLEFGNSIAQVAEDENMLNEFLAKTSDKFNQKKVNRFLIFLAFGMVAVFGLVTYFWQKKLLRKTASDVAYSRQRQFSKRKRIMVARDRQQAASLLLNSFCLEAAHRRLNDWPMFPQGLELGDDEEALQMINEMTDAHQAVRSENELYWTPDRLAKLDQQVQSWHDRLASDDKPAVGVDDS